MKHLILAVLILISINCFSQNNVKLEGNTFSVEQVESKDTKTKYTYKDKKGNEYPIYLSKRGKAYIIRTSKKGNQYKQYLPEITKQLNGK